MKERYKQVAERIKYLIETEKFFTENGKADKINKLRRKYVPRIRQELKRANEYYRDPIEKSISEGWRGQIDYNCGDSGTDYRILKVENVDEWTDDDIEEYIMENVGYPPICSPYDCTGKRFTMWTHWSRQPAGIVMIHQWGLDV